MLNFLASYADVFQLFNLLNYLTVRAGGAMLTAFFLSMWMGPSLILRFRVWQRGGNTVKDVLPHAGKAGTPTMGGVLVIGTFVASVLLWTKLSNPFVWLCLFVVTAFFTIGFVDDWLNLRKLWKNGLPGRLRLSLQTVVAIVAVFSSVHLTQAAQPTGIQLPFLKELVVDFGIFFFVLFGAFVVVGTANAVNLTDGLDGLVSIPAGIVAASFAALAYLIGRADYTSYLNIAFVPGAGEMAVACGAMVGALLGFLWYNAPPARIFMGDTGSLPLGGFLGLVAVLIKQEFTLMIVGGLFVMETVSVIVQVTVFKMTGKRVLRMAPLHHHFEQKGWPESTIVVRFWIISLILAMIGLATLKLR